MKRLIIYFSFFFIGGVILKSCYTDNIISPELEYAPQYVSFNNDLAPLLKAKCALAGCHVPGSKNPFLDDVKTSFKNIIGGHYISILTPKESVFYKFVIGEMGEYTTQEEKLKIYDWIRNGATNN